MKKLCFILSLLSMLTFMSCKSSNPQILKTHEQTPTDKVVEAIVSSEYVTGKTYYEMTDGTFLCNNISYKYKLEVSGVLNNAKHERSYIVLSNTKDLTFEQVWKASGLSSNSNDYFNPADAVIVAMK